MKKITVLALILTFALAATASAQPGMLSKGHMSIGATASSQSRINFGWNMADLAKLIVGFGFENTKPDQTDPTVTPESESSWNLDFGFNKYLGGAATSNFAPFVGAAVLIADEGDARETGYGFRFYFGGEGFVTDHVSIGADIGLDWAQRGKRSVTDGEDLDGRQTFQLSTRPIMATVWW